ncbi:MAG TPA: hypothetical protein VGI74_23045 [Streptosporangiaceae bacterium]|jgi:hypothetical protein
MARPEEFIQLYLQYRVDEMITWHTKRCALIRRRNLRFQISILTSILLTAGSVALVGLDSSVNGVWVAATILFLGTAFVLTAVLLASGSGRRADINSNAAKALSLMRDRKPGSTASELDVERWVWQTEAIISSAG